MDDLSTPGAWLLFELREGRTPGVGKRRSDRRFLSAEITAALGCRISDAERAELLLLREKLRAAEAVN